MESDDIFVREVNIESCKKKLQLYQKSVGDVNCIVWDGALALAKYLDNLGSQKGYGYKFTGKNVLELGAGVGCVGMTAAILGANVIVTDLENTMPILEKNILMNKNAWKDTGGSIQARVLDWNGQSALEVLNGFKPDVILMSDCIYYSESIDPLVKTLLSICNSNPNAYVLLSQELRDTPKQIAIRQDFFNKINKCFQIENIPKSQQHPVYTSDDIMLIKLTKIK